MGIVHLDRPFHCYLAQGGAPLALGYVTKLLRSSAQRITRPAIDVPNRIDADVLFPAAPYNKKLNFHDR